jgi:hypothetical protein
MYTEPTKFLFREDSKMLPEPVSYSATVTKYT